jgi:hypothetical protein
MSLKRFKRMEEEAFLFWCWCWGKEFGR